MKIEDAKTNEQYCGDDINWHNRRNYVFVFFYHIYILKMFVAKLFVFTFVYFRSAECLKIRYNCGPKEDGFLK